MLPPMLAPAYAPARPALSPYAESPMPSSSSSSAYNFPSSSSSDDDYDPMALSRYFPFLLLVVALVFFLVEAASPNPFDAPRRAIQEHERLMRQRQRILRERQREEEQNPPPPCPLPPPVQPSALGAIMCTYRVEKAGSNGEGVECAICLEEFKAGDECKRFVSCRHGFHEPCISQWLALEPNCPLCRGFVRDLPITNLDHQV